MKIAITGTMGAGKSSLASFLRDLNYQVYDADALVHQAYLKDGDLYDDILLILGNDVVDTDGEIDRKKMALMIFNNSLLLEKVESIVFTYIKNFIVNIPFDSKPMFFELPLLFESHLEVFFDKIWLLDADRELRMKRLLDKGYTHQDIEAREARQFNIEYKKQKADIILMNDKSLEDLKEAVLIQIKEMTHEL